MNRIKPKKLRENSQKISHTRSNLHYFVKTIIFRYHNTEILPCIADVKGWIFDQIAFFKHWRISNGYSMLSSNITTNTFQFQNFGQNSFSFPLISCCCDEFRVDNDCSQTDSEVISIVLENVASVLCKLKKCENFSKKDNMQRSIFVQEVILSAGHGEDMLKMKMIENSCFKPVGIILEKIITKNTNKN